MHRTQVGIFILRHNAVLTGAVGFSSKRSLIEKFAVTGPVPGVRPAWA
jgi:hypothetical protein